MALSNEQLSHILQRLSQNYPTIPVSHGGIEAHQNQRSVPDNSRKITHNEGFGHSCPEKFIEKNPTTGSELHTMPKQIAKQQYNKAQEDSTETRTSNFEELENSLDHNIKSNNAIQSVNNTLADYQVKIPDQTNNGYIQSEIFDISYMSNTEIMAIKQLIQNAEDVTFCIYFSNKKPHYRSQDKEFITSPFYALKPQGLMISISASINDAIRPQHYLIPFECQQETVKTCKELVYFMLNASTVKICYDWQSCLYHMIRFYMKEIQTAVLDITPIRIDTELLRDYQPIFEAKLEALEKKAHQVYCIIFIKRLRQSILQISGYSFSLQSPKQIETILFEKLKLDQVLKLNLVLKTKKKQSLSTSDEVLNKIKSTSIDGILRLMKKNMQAIPKAMIDFGGIEDTKIFGENENETYKGSYSPRDMIITKKNYSLVSVDFQAIELRLLAHFSNDSMLLQIFNEHPTINIYTWLATFWFNKNIDDISQAEFDQAKEICYSILYGIVKFPAVAKYKQNLIRRCHEQGSAADLYKLRLIELFAILTDEAFKSVRSLLFAKLFGRFLIQNHDELLFEVENQEIPGFTSIIIFKMNSC
ncbi:DNA polymerase nu [Trichoplax sp. H2]|nr:DNA polymerase nu [Trichoplax sp. H2]|eukprot:RDD42369.1 DNA polymerase nu [Trichoplax sp. H2]